MTRVRREVRGGSEQLISDVQRERRIIAGKREFCTRVPDKPLSNGSGRIIWLKRGVEEGFGTRHIVLRKTDESKEPRYNASPIIASRSPVRV